MVAHGVTLVWRVLDVKSLQCLYKDKQLVRSNTIFVGDSSTNNEVEYAGVTKGLKVQWTQGGPHPGLLVATRSL